MRPTWIPVRCERASVGSVVTVCVCGVNVDGLCVVCVYVCVLAMCSLTLDIE